MAEHNLLGKKGEEIAQQYLVSHGYKIIATNWLFNHKEIDIIAREGEILVFVEVKTRTENYWGNPEEFVSKKKQKLLIIAAESYINEINFSGESRFDIISILLYKEGTHIEHIKEAFYP
jgi:putative endonuclease